MSLNLFNYNNSLFSGFSSNSSGMSNMLGDYMAIRNGSYGKLLKAYYAKQDDGAKKTAGAIRRENALKKSQADSEEVKQYKDAQSDASTLKSAASSIRSNSKLFEQVEQKTTDENGEEKVVVDYDRDKISSAVKSFVKAYNSAIKSAYEQGSSIVQKKAASMVSETASNKNMLARVERTTPRLESGCSSLLELKLFTKKDSKLYNYTWTGLFKRTHHKSHPSQMNCSSRCDCNLTC